MTKTTVIESSVTSVSWIPSEAIDGLPRLPFELGVGHYDDPLPDRIDDLEGLRQADAFRFANQLRAFVEVDGGVITGYGQLGRGLIGSTTLRIGPRAVVFQATPFPELRPPSSVSQTSVTFVQTAGGRPGVPLPRTVRHRPYVQLAGPTVWSTLALTIHADGTSTFELRGASSFPRHWIYDQHGNLTAKSATVDFRRWSEESFGTHTPWGDEDSPAMVTVAETALERELATQIMRGGETPVIRRRPAGVTVVRQGECENDIHLLLDGVLAVEVDGTVVAELGPGAVVGERAGLEGGGRTATLRAVTPVKVATTPADRIDSRVRAELAEGHRRERTSSGHERDAGVR